MDGDGDGERQVKEGWGRREDRGMNGGGGGGGIYQPATLKVVMTLIAAAFVRAGDRPPRRLILALPLSLSLSLALSIIRSHLPACTQVSIHSGTCKQKT